MLRSSYRAVVAGLVLLPLLASAAPSPPRRPRPDPRPPAAPAGRTAQAPGGTPATARQGAPAAADASGDDERCFEIRRIELEGAGHLGESARRQLLAPYQGRCLGVGQLNALLKAVTDHYLDRGYVTTRAYLPQQDLASGTLRIIVVEGRLEGLDSSALASPRELAMSFPGRTGELLDLRELEQLVDQLSRLPSRQAQLELVPGSEVGGSRVRLKGERDKPWRVSATRNNDGDVSTGEQQMGLGLDWDSPLGLADQLNLRANRDAVTDRWRHSDSQSLFYSLPWGWWTFTYGYSQSDYRTRNEASGFPFKLDGDSRSHQFRAERVLHRDGVSKTAMSLGLSHQRTNNYVEDTRLEDQSTRITETQLGFNHGRRIGSGFVNQTSAGSRASAPLARRVAATRRRAIRMRATTSTA